MRQVAALVTVASLNFFAACAQSFNPATATYDQFRMAKGPYPVKVIAILPGGELADAIGVELGKRGFVVFPASSTVNLVTGVDFKAVAESYIPKRENPRAVENLKSQLLSQGIDAFLTVVRPDDFTPRQWRDNPYWQTASIHLYSTHPEMGHGYSTLLWANVDKNRAKTPSEAAADVVTSLARRSGP